MRWGNLLSIGAGVLLMAASSGAGQEKKAAPKPPMDEKAMMEMMQKLATPGEGHKKIDFMVGTWKTKNTMWMDPSKPPEKSEGTAEQRWVLGGRFIEQHFEGTFMGMPFSGLGYSGYYNYKKKYLSTWMDTFGTTMMNMTGSFDAAGKAMTFTGRMDDFTTGKVVTIREKLTVVTKDEFLLEMWGPDPQGKDFKMMEIRYTRKK